MSTAVLPPITVTKPKLPFVLDVEVRFDFNILQSCCGIKFQNRLSQQRLDPVGDIIKQQGSSDDPKIKNELSPVDENQVCCFANFKFSVFITF